MSVGGKSESCDICNGTIGRVGARYPEWRGEDGWARLYREIDFSVIEVAGAVGEVGFDLDGS